MQIRKVGDFVRCFQGKESFVAFIPRPLPPDPPIKFDVELNILMDKANRSLGRLDGVTSRLPNTILFTQFYIKKEALLSSQIEGTKSTFSDILKIEFDRPKEIPEDTQEVLNYIFAIRHGFNVLKQSDEPEITFDLLFDLHKLLLAKTRGGNKPLGQIKPGLNWSGDGKTPSTASMVFTPPENTWECLNDLINFLNNVPERTPVLMKVALAHVQFESIHPFEDGNGRIGRLLIVLLLCMEEALAEPMLYLSLYFKKNNSEYVERMQNVREKGDWEGWLKFFFQGVIYVTNEAIDAANEVLTLFAENTERIESLRTSNTPHRIHEYLKKYPITSIKRLSKDLKTSVPSITNGLKQLEKLEVVEEQTGYSRNRLFAYQTYINILAKGTLPDINNS
jgi:Fic family protein